MVLILLCVLFAGLLCPVRPARFPAPLPGPVSEVSLPPGDELPCLACLDEDDDRDEVEESLPPTASVVRGDGLRLAPGSRTPFSRPPTAPPSRASFRPLLI